MENIKMEDLVEEVDSTSETTQVETQVEDETETKVETEHDPLKIELDRVQKVSKYTEEEKAEFTLKKTAERLKALGKDPASILGIDKEETIEDEDDKPLTIGEWKRMQKENASKTALQQADDIQNETERELVKYHLQNTIKSTGIPSEDLKLARALVNAVKNTKIIEEVSRKTPPKTHSNSSGVDAKVEKEVTLTLEEQQLMSVGGLTIAEVLEARDGKKFKFQNTR